MRLTSSIDSGTAQPLSPCISRLKPSRMPTTPTPATRARMVAAPMTLLIPGAGPPPHSSATRCDSGMLAPKSIEIVYHQGMAGGAAARRRVGIVVGLGLVLAVFVGVVVVPRGLVPATSHAGPSVVTS